MAERIQRVPQGLLPLLGVLSGGKTPEDLEDHIAAVIESTQLFGNQQRAVQQNATVAAEGGQLNITIPSNQWWVLFGASLTISKTATMTALRGAIRIGQVFYASEELGPFGATETGDVAVVFVPPYARVLPPGTVLTGIPQIIGTDANATCVFAVDVGILG